jgi:hypothetical protein
MPQFVAARVVVLFLFASLRSSPPGLLVVRVLDTKGVALPNAEVIDLESGAGRFTNDSGLVRMQWPSSRRLRLRVRELGFKPVERLVDASPDSLHHDSLTVVLERVAFSLPPVVTREDQRCDANDSAASFRAVPALQQLRIGAERYARFRTSYPFRVEVERRTVSLSEEGKPKSVRQNKEQANSEDWGDPYVPGEIVHRERLGFSVSILFLAALADSSFWTRHCFSVRGIGSLANQRVVQMDFTPANGARDPEWEGTAFIDSATSVLTRLQFRLKGLPDDDSPRRLEGYTTFMSPSPYITIPDSIVAYWWRHGPSSSGEWKSPDIVQLIHVLNIRYRKGAP